MYATAYVIPKFQKKGRILRSEHLKVNSQKFTLKIQFVSFNLHFCSDTTYFCILFYVCFNHFTQYGRTKTSDFWSIFDLIVDRSMRNLIETSRDE